MGDKFKLEAFLIKTYTADGYSVIVGGFCPEGKAEESNSKYLEINKKELGQSKDEFLIDFILSNAITQLSPKWISIVGASVSIAGVKNSTGGILGNPFEGHDSAGEEIEEITSGLYVISFPGGPGIAYAGTYSDGILLKNMILTYKKYGNSNIEDIINILDKITKLYIFVADGCGSMSCGGIYISDYYGKKFETF